MSEKEKVNTEPGVSKILMLGLDNSGKTSIVLSLKGKTNLLSYYSLNPTKKMEKDRIQMLYSEINIWDFGGQEQYRDKHLENFNKHVIGASKIIYVIDVQDKDRYEIAIEYFQKIINLIKDKSDIDVSIFLHKFDPDLGETFPEINEKVVGALIQKIKVIIPSNIFYKIFKTTIYTMFEKTIIE